ncbi:peptide chain release factor 1 [Candidatus Dependentiae bacterium]|nr:peptide chain release factor 1 [Candidatus Dependentiae bacterium]
MLTQLGELTNLKNVIQNSFLNKKGFIVFDKWDALKRLHNELEQKILSGNVTSKDRAQIQKDLSLFSDLLEVHKTLESLKAEFHEAQLQHDNEADQELKDMFAVELQDLQKKINQKEKELDELLYPADDLSSRPAYLEIRAGTGGQEAALFVADLLKMYLLYAEKRGWKAEIESESSTDLGGFKEVIVYIKGKNAFGSLKRESGVHRVQRVPATEGSGRVHTSTATVAVLPEAEDIDFQLNEADLRFDVFRSSGAGGQHVNTTDSAVRVTHIPTGVAVACQEERSQHKNKAKALKLLKSRLLAHAQEEKRQKESLARKEQIGSGERSEKIRTYNYPQNRVTDHQIDLTLKSLDFVMQGDLDEIIQGLLDYDRKARTLHPLLSQL